MVGAKTTEDKMKPEKPCLTHAKAEPEDTFGTGNVAVGHTIPCPLMAVTVKQRNQH